MQALKMFYPSSTLGKKHNYTHTFNIIHTHLNKYMYRDIWLIRNRSNPDSLWSLNLFSLYLPCFFIQNFFSKKIINYVNPDCRVYFYIYLSCISIRSNQRIQASLFIVEVNCWRHSGILNNIKQKK
jgi:hypothetical protein